MQRIVDETFRRGRFATWFAAAAFLLLSACGTEKGVAPLAPRAVTDPPVATTQLGLTSAFDPYIFLIPTTDDAGANDDPDQSDLNSFTRADNVSGRLAVAWTWDDINSWTGSGQTGDACALFDTDAPGTPAHSMARLPDGVTKQMLVEHPTGASPVSITTTEHDGNTVVTEAAIISTARALFEGHVLVP